MRLYWKYIFALLSLATATVWFAVLAYPQEKLKMVACDVGQGDALLATYKDTQILVDGGRGTKVLDCLAKYMPFWDREIELVLLSHPQLDHLGGLVEVLKRYSVETFVASALDSDSQEYKALKNEIRAKSVSIINPTTGLAIDVGVIHLDIVWPSHQFLKENGAELMAHTNEAVLGAFTSSRNTNEFSVVANLSFGEFDALLTSDIGPAVMDNVVGQLVLSDSRSIEYIKVPHHGSKNGLTKELIDVTVPEIAIISVGAKNSYGHPHEVILKILSERDIKILRTDEVGDVVVVTDGKKWWLW